jgi:hypothetical protein
VNHVVTGRVHASAANRRQAAKASGQGTLISHPNLTVSKTVAAPTPTVRPARRQRAETRKQDAAAISRPCGLGQDKCPKVAAKAAISHRLGPAKATSAIARNNRDLSAATDSDQITSAMRGRYARADPADHRKGVMHGFAPEEAP